MTGRGFFRFGIVKFTAKRSRGAPPTTPPAELIEEYGALLSFVNGLDSPSPDDLHDAVRRIEGFGGHLGQARACRQDPPGFEDGLESADELFDALHNMLVRMFGAGPNGVPWTGGDLVRLLDLAVDLQILGPSAVNDALTQTIAAALEARLEGALERCDCRGGQGDDRCDRAGGGTRGYADARRARADGAGEEQPPPP